MELTADSSEYGVGGHDTGTPPPGPAPASAGAASSAPASTGQDSR